MPRQMRRRARLLGPCAESPGGCRTCPADGLLMCRYEPRDLLSFLVIVLPFGFTCIAGTLSLGVGRYLWLWLAYSLLFFFGWEARVLCSHCPHWGMAGRILRCHANYGVLKLWRYRPGPMGRSERIQFVCAALLWLAIPLAVLAAAGGYLLATIAAVAALSGVFGLQRMSCVRCLHFSCPLNAAPADLRRAYLERNPTVASAWRAAGMEPW